MVPGRSSAANCMALPRSRTSRVPSAKESAPEATRAVYSPRLWPAQAAGKRPRRSTASRTTRLITKVASWALAVRVSSSIGASRRRAVRSRPASSEASDATSHEGWSTQARPIPERCDPCPGKVKASTCGLLSDAFELFDHGDAPSVTRGRWGSLLTGGSSAYGRVIDGSTGGSVGGSPADGAGDRSGRPAVPGAGLEPARPFGQWILSPSRLPFRHPGRWPVSLPPPPTGAVGSAHARRRRSGRSGGRGGRGIGDRRSGGDCEAVELHRVELRVPPAGPHLPGRRTGAGRWCWSGWLGTTDDGEAVEGWGECAALADTDLRPRGRRPGRLARSSTSLVPACWPRAAGPGGVLPPTGRLAGAPPGAPGRRRWRSPPWRWRWPTPTSGPRAVPGRPARGRRRRCRPGRSSAGPTSTAELVAAVDGLVAAGYRRVKLKIGPGWDVEPVAAVRRRLSRLLAPGRRQRRLHGRPTPATWPAWTGFGLLCLEQPFDRRDLGRPRPPGPRLATPVCLDESLDVARGRGDRVALRRLLGGLREARPARGASAPPCDGRRHAGAGGVPLWIGGMFESRLRPGGQRRAGRPARASPGPATWPGRRLPGRRRWWRRRCTGGADRAALAGWWPRVRRPGPAPGPGAVLRAGAGGRYACRRPEAPIGPPGAPVGAV